MKGGSEKKQLNMLSGGRAAKGESKQEGEMGKREKNESNTVILCREL